MNYRRLLVTASIHSIFQCVIDNQPVPGRCKTINFPNQMLPVLKANVNGFLLINSNLFIFLYQYIQYIDYNTLPSFSFVYS